MKLSKPIAWMLILWLGVQPVVTSLFAEEGTKLVRRRSVNPAATPAQAEGEALAIPAAASQRREATQAEASLAKRNQILTVVSPQSRTPAGATPLAVETSSNIALQDTGFREELDILSPDDTSPILAESIFGSKGRQRINLVADNVEVKSIMDHLATEYRLNIVSREIATNNRIKTSLYDIPLETVFQVLLEQASLSYEKRNGIIYLQDRGKGKDYFLEERFFKIKEFADFGFAEQLIKEIATTKGEKILPNSEKKTFFVIAYKATLNRIQKMLGDLGYLEEMDPDSATLMHHYLSYQYVEKKVVEEIIRKHQSKDGKTIPDEKSNRFIIFDTMARFNLMREALEFVDVPPGQVFIDVKFLDLNEDDEKRLGMSQTIDWNGQANDTDRFAFSLASDVTRQLNWQVTPVANLAISGAHDILNTKIINNPKIMVINNEQANIQVTENFPYVTNENSNGVISSEIQQTPIGVTLNVKPKILASGEVQMDLEPKITVLKEVKIITTKVIDTNQAGGRTTEADSEYPVIDERSIKTKVNIPNGKTLIIGGLIKESDRKTLDQIPGLSRLPLLGRFFKRDTDTKSQAQLYIFITPTIVRGAPKSRAYEVAKADLPKIVTSDADVAKAAKDVPGLTVEPSGDEMAKKDELEVPNPVQIAKPSPKVEDERIDFSSFLKKIAALKEKERQENLENTARAREEAQEKQGFDRLISQLKEDIRKEDVTLSEVQAKKAIQAAKPEVSTGGSVQTMEKEAARDRILGDRAERIANLLKAWQDNPVDGVMVPKSAVRDIDLRPRVPIQLLPDGQTREPTPRPLPDTGRQPMETKLIQPETTEQVEGPAEQTVVEAPITMDFFSPLGRKPDSRSSAQPGFFFGDVSRPEAENQQRVTPVQREGAPQETLEVEKIPQQNPEASDLEDTSDAESSGSAPVRRRVRKKVGWLAPPEPMSAEKPLTTADFMSESTPARKVARNQSGPRTFELQFNSPAEQGRQETGNQGDWVQDFLKEDLAEIVYTDLSRGLEEASKPQQEVARSEVAQTPVMPSSQTEAQNMLEEARRMLSELKAAREGKPAASETLKPKTEVKPPKEVARQSIMRSSDPRTQAIFDSLSRKPVEEKPMAAQPLRAPEILTAPPQVEARPPAEISRKSSAEEEFSSFLKDMFVEGSSENVALNSAKKTPVKTEAQAEKDMADFLKGL